ncbi:catechol 2,3-dioxygenase [Aureimonas jatrophae]|uniref:Catechol 2,3-dioxygenase n=1 Tax=Aureimonas jatrophae TaxID=1166073 RepID=A0A1H0GQZ7_9HYPH|nr:catechol 2,3-dioxygenase [Aureimonas jatrophae]
MMTPLSTVSNPPLRIGRVALAVRDVQRAREFYRTALGLEDIAPTDDALRLGVDGYGFLELHRAPEDNRRAASEAGLFHTAFLLPSRADLGRWLRHASSIGLQIAGASDHGVSEAVYLSDPEGNGIEIYVDRPASLWPRDGTALRMTTQRLSIPSVLTAAGSTSWHGAPSGTTIGHVHLRVGDLTSATDFYRNVVGLDLTVEVSGASFLSSGGYHHHLAVNVWHSRGAATRKQGDAGLKSVEFLARERVWVDAIADRASRAGVLVARHSDHAEVVDPAGNRIRIA